MGIRGILWDKGLLGRISVSTDASAAQGVASRRELGKVKNIELNQLWVQDRVCRGDVKIRKVDGTQNLADALTKPLGAKGIEWQLEKLGMKVESGRHCLMPAVSVGIDGYDRGDGVGEDMLDWDPQPF